MDMRLEFASTKEDITTELAVRAATIAAMVHHFKENGFTTHLHQIRDKYWWTEEYRRSLQSSDRRDGPRRSGMERMVWGWNVCVAAVKGYDVVGRADFYSYKKLPSLS
jgi:hypothetical protein